MIDDLIQFPEAHKEKRCTHCKTFYPLSDFNKDKWQKYGLSNKCKTCASAESKRGKLAPKAAIGTGCEICGQTESTSGRPLCADHDHDSLKYRGFLCSSCNISLGQFSDSPQILSNAIAYLARHGKALTEDQVDVLLGELHEARNHSPDVHEFIQFGR